MLIQNGADVNALNKEDYTPLHCSAREAHVDVAKVLIRNGVDVNALSVYEESAICITAYNGRVRYMQPTTVFGADIAWWIRTMKELINHTDYEKIFVTS